MVVSKKLVLLILLSFKQQSTCSSTSFSNKIDSCYCKHTIQFHSDRAAYMGSRWIFTHVISYLNCYFIKTVVVLKYLSANNWVPYHTFGFCNNCSKMMNRYNITTWGLSDIWNNLKNLLDFTWECPDYNQEKTFTAATVTQELEWTYRVLKILYLFV